MIYQKILIVFIQYNTIQVWIISIVLVEIRYKNLGVKIFDSVKCGHFLQKK